MSSFDPFDLIHLEAGEILNIHDQILETSAGLPGTRPGMHPDSIVGRIHLST